MGVVKVALKFRQMQKRGGENNIMFKKLYYEEKSCSISDVMIKRERIASKMAIRFRVLKGSNVETIN